MDKERLKKDHFLSKIGKPGIFCEFDASGRQAPPELSFKSMKTKAFLVILDLVRILQNDLHLRGAQANLSFSLKKLKKRACNRLTKPSARWHLRWA